MSEPTNTARQDVHTLANENQARLADAVLHELLNNPKGPADMLATVNDWTEGLADLLALYAFENQADPIPSDTVEVNARLIAGLSRLARAAANMLADDLKHSLARNAYYNEKLNQGEA